MFVHTDTIIKQIVAEYLMNSILVAKIETVSRCMCILAELQDFLFDSNLTLLCFAVCETIDMLMKGMSFKTY